ncbi:MAG TPA: insulinase family protein [Syntrophobacteraceae bacterium]|nr:insulinase family protein [Syntrophobacteraceae bacterium]
MAAKDKFELIFEKQIAELRGVARFYRHIPTGAELLSIINEDDNKVFGVCFRTPPSDSSGVAHILEHSVLCGSRKYPVKEPFVELIKGSLKTFLNAFTYPDKTCYPVASQNAQDFYNLVDVYLDAVFYPRLTPFVFQQEGWHYELYDPEAPLEIKGVVYNEMKGVYSSPDSLLSEISQQSLFPDTTYGLDSGGDPRVIPTLTFEQFKSFHSKFYHPSNSRIYFYGNDDPDGRLEIVQQYLQDFIRAEPDSAVPLQAPKRLPARIVRSFGVGPDDAGSGGLKGMVTVNWLLPEVTDAELNLAFQVLEYVLIGMPGSPLRKALIDSGLGEDIAGVGLETELRQLFFSIGLKGIRPGDADKVETIIFETLSTLARDGIDPETIQAGVNTIEFRLRENNYGNFPQGLAVMLRALCTWLHDADPTSLPAFESPLNQVKQHLRSGGFLEGLIQRHLIENTHRTVVLLQPEPGLAEKEIEEETRRLEAIRDSFPAEKIGRIIEKAKTLQEIQSRPDSPEALARIPVLKISDLDKRNRIIPIEPGPVPDVLAFYHDLFTSGIAYLDVGFNLQVLPEPYLPYAPLFGRMLLEMGTDFQDFVSLSQKISCKTGGIHPEVFTSSVIGNGLPATWLFLRGKSMTGQMGDLADILSEVLGAVKLDDRERLRQIVLTEKARQERKIVPSGHQLINLRIRAHYNHADWVRELTDGISYFLFLGQLAGEIDNDWESVLSTLEKVRSLLTNSSTMAFNLTAGRKDLHSIEGPLRGFLRSLPERAPVMETWQRTGLFAQFEGIMIPSQVNYVGKGADLYREGYEPHGSSKVVAGYLRSTWLWEKVRVQGGAYGGFCLFDRMSGVFTFISYRDPNLMKTIENFDGAAEFLRRADLPEDEVRKAIIGAIGDMDSHMLPDMKGYVSMLRRLTGESEEMRQKMREQVLGATAKDFRAFAEVLEKVNSNGIVKVLGAQASIDSALAERPGWLKTFRLL